MHCQNISLFILQHLKNFRSVCVVPIYNLLVVCLSILRSVCLSVLQYVPFHLAVLCLSLFRCVLYLHNPQSNWFTICIYIRQSVRPFVFMRHVKCPLRNLFKRGCLLLGPSVRYQFSLLILQDINKDSWLSLSYTYVWQLQLLGRHKPFQDRHKFKTDNTFVIFFFKLKQNYNDLPKNVENIGEKRHSKIAKNM